METIRVKTAARFEMVEITGKVREICAKSKVSGGVCLVFCPHTTAGLTINENADPSVRRDIVIALKGLVPETADYTHAEGNSDSHIKSSLFGPSVSVIVEKGELMLGTWQGIFFCESDGPRSREIWVKIIDA